MSAGKKRFVREDRLRFLLFPDLQYATRWLLIIALIVAGLTLQFFFHWIVGVVLIFLGALLGSVRSVIYKPPYKRGETEWKEVLPEQWDHALGLIKKGRSWKRSITNPASLPIFFLPFFIVVVVVFFALYEEIFAEHGDLVLMVLANIGALFGPTLLVGYLQTWQPPGLEVKLEALRGVLKEINRATIPDLLPMPMLEMMTEYATEEGSGIPTDARMMIRFKGAPEKFYGVQVQASINTVGGTSYPYVYAVILFAEDFSINQRDIPGPTDRQMVFEPSREGEVVVLVLRQKTSKTSGYHTAPRRQWEIVREAIGIAGAILQRADKKA
jgi:hypothetical protein